MAVEKLSDGNPTLLGIGFYEGNLSGAASPVEFYAKGMKTFDGIVATNLLNELRKLIGVHCINPLIEDYESIPEVDFAMAIGPPARGRMLGERPNYRQFYDTIIRRTRVARIILQEFPWPPPRNKGALNFSFGPPGNTLLPPLWGKGWFAHNGVYWLYPFADKHESRPVAKEDFVFVDCSDPWDGNWDFSKSALQALDELGVEYYRATHKPAKRIPREEFINKINKAKLYLQVKAESYGLTLMEAVASETIVLGTPRTLRTPYINEFGFKTVPTPSVETLKKAITTALSVYDKPEVKEYLHAAREKLWTYERLAREIVDILRKLKG